MTDSNDENDAKVNSHTPYFSPPPSPQGKGSADGNSVTNFWGVEEEENTASPLNTTEPILAKEYENLFSLMDNPANDSVSTDTVSLAPVSTEDIEQQWGVPARVSRPRRRTPTPQVVEGRELGEKTGRGGEEGEHFSVSPAQHVEGVTPDESGGDTFNDQNLHKVDDNTELLLGDEFDNESKFEDGEGWEENRDEREEGDGFEEGRGREGSTRTHPKTAESKEGAKLRITKIQRKPVRGKTEETLARYAGFFAVTLGWIILPFLSGFLAIFLSNRARVVAMTGRKRDIRKIRQARKFGLISLALSFISIILFGIIIIVVLPAAVRMKTESTVTNTAGGALSPQDAITGQTVDSAGTFLQAAVNNKSTVTQTGSGVDAMLTSVNGDGTKTYFTYGRFTTPNAIQLTGFTPAAPVTTFCVSAPYTGGSSMGKPYFLYSNTTATLTQSAQPCG